MSSDSHASHDEHDHGHDDGHGHEGGGHHVDPLWLYWGIFGSLLVMTVITVAASYVDFGAANTVIAVLIASVKAFLVAFFFMHLRHDKPFHTLVFTGGLLFLSFLFLFTLADQGTRNDVDTIHGQKIEKKDPTPAAAASGSAAPAAPAKH